MILRRLMHHMKDQNWFAVGLDLIVVIVGIFLGMQVNEWNSQRKDIQSEQQYLEALAEEFTANVEEARRLSNLHATYRNRSRAIRIYLLQPAPVEGMQDKLLENRIVANVMPSAQYSMGTYEELVSIGKINILRNKKLRQALQEFSAAVHRYEGQLDYFRQTNHSQSSIIEKMRYNYLDAEGNPHSRVELDKNMGNQALINAYGTAMASHFMFSHYRGNEQGLAQNVLSLVQCELKQAPCEQEKNQ